MQKILRRALLALCLLCFTLPGIRAEAATVALLPLLNNAGEESAGQIYFQCALEKTKELGDFELVDNDRLNAAVEAVMAETGAAVPDAAALQRIAAEGGVDIVIAMQLDKYDDKIRHSSKVRMKQLDLRGRTASYSSLTGRAYSHSFKNDKQVEVALTSRWDVKREEWGRTVRNEVERALKAK